MKGKHIKNYAKVKARIKKWKAKKDREIKAAIKFTKATLANKDNWKNGICYYPDTLGPYCYKDHECSEDTLKRMEESLKYHEKYSKQMLDRLEKADKAGDVIEIEISVEWKKNRTWGSNPRATVWVRYMTPNGTDGDRAESGSIGGCGYDKESTAVQEAFDRLKDGGLAALDRLVIEKGEKLWKEYAIDANPYPHFNFSGKGMSTFRCLFPTMGNRKYSKDRIFSNFVMSEIFACSVSNSYHVARRDVV